MKKIFLIPLIIVVAGALIFGGCAKPAPTGPEEILIGACESVTGVFSGFCAGGTFGLRAATEDINKQGGVYVEEYGRKLPVKLIVVDNESDPAKASTLANDLVLRDKVHVLVNSPGPCTLFNPQSAVAEQYKIPYIAGEGPLEPWQGARMEASPPWQYTWGFGFAIATPAPAGDFRHGKPGYTVFDAWYPVLEMFAGTTNKKIAVFASDDADGRGWYKTFAPELEKRGLDVIGEEKELGLAPMDTTDFSPMIKEWQKNKCELLWSNSPGPFFGVMWRQAYSLGWVPKLALAGRAGMFYEDVSAWGGDLPWGVGTDRWWDPSYPPESFPGIGETTPKTLFDRWFEELGRPLNQGMGWGYFPMQVLFDAIERAGTLDGPALSKAIGETDMMTISGRAVFTKEEQHCRLPLTYGQWMKTDEPWVWECPVVFSQHDFIKATAEPLFPIPSTTFK